MGTARLIPRSSMMEKISALSFHSYRVALDRKGRTGRQVHRSEFTWYLEEPPAQHEFEEIKMTPFSVEREEMK